MQGWFIWNMLTVSDTESKQFKSFHIEKRVLYDVNQDKNN